MTDITALDSKSPNIELYQEGGVLHLVLNRPERKNALTQAMYGALAQAIEMAGEEAGVKALLIRGAGECFTSGNDLEDFMDNPTGIESSSVMRFMQALYLTSKPVVAAIEGAAIGIGTTMLLHCDLVYAAAGTRLQLPFVNLGLCPEYASSLLLPRMLGHLRAAELLFLGESFSAERAEELGLVNQVVSDDELLLIAKERCQFLAQQPPAALRHTKQLLKESWREEGQAVIRREAELFAGSLQSAEFGEAVAAFFEKRNPDFSNFS